MQKKFYLLILLSSLFFVKSQAQMRVHLINVGQGCATLIEFPCAAILIDAGGESNPLYNSSEALQTYLEDFFARRTDLNKTFQCVYLTHPHQDHTLGIPVVLESYKIKNVVTDGLEKGSGKRGQILLHQAAQDSEGTENPIGLEAVITRDIPVTGLTTPVIDAVACDVTDPVIKILWGAVVTKPAGWNQTAFSNGNNHSLVIRIEYGRASVLISGDLEDVAQASVLAKYANNTLLDADVYVVGHHASRNGSSVNFINKVSPKIALIGVGDPARETSWTGWAYGHPNKTILDRLQQKITTTRDPIGIQAGTGAKTFVDYTVNKAIYATAWDDNVILEADAAGLWKKIDEVADDDLVNINTASEEELQSLPGIGATKAKAIVDFRRVNGPFSSIEKLDDVPGIGPVTIKLVRPYAKI